MKLLVVGAGAVGSVYGYFASRVPGAEVTYLVKPKHRAGLSAGLRLYRWSRRDAEPIDFIAFRTIDSLDVLASERFDAALLTLPSDRMRDAAWLEPFLRAIGETEIWSLAPNASDGEVLEATRATVLGRRREQLPATVYGSIPIMSYLAPLPGEDFPQPGYAFFLPPGQKAGWWCRDRPRAQATADFFASGGLPAVVSADREASGLVIASLLKSLVAVLERSEWSLAKLVHGSYFPLIADAAREMIAIRAKELGRPDPSASFPGRIATSPFAIRALLRLIGFVTPFDLEAFLRVHFTKVEDQMHLGINEAIEAGRRMGLPTTNLTLLRGRAKRAEPEGKRPSPVPENRA